MTRLLYISNARIPSPMAHGLQIMQNCEAFAEAGAEVSLWCRWSGVADTWAFYGVAPRFALRRLYSLDLTRFITGQDNALSRLFFYLQTFTLALSALVITLFVRADLIYCRDPLVLLVLSLRCPRHKLVYEAHRLNRPGKGAWLQRQVLRRVGHTVAITLPLRDGLEKLQTTNREKSRLLVAHDGIREGRFQNLPDQRTARQQVGWSGEYFIVGYVGRLKTLGMDKGVDTIIDAIAEMPERDRVALALVGGPDDIAELYRQRWLDKGLSAAYFLYAGQVPPDEVPPYLSAFDVCVLPLPWTEHFAYYASPIKLFEYMASGRALVASDLPAYADVLTDGENALLVPPSDVGALAAALSRLLHNPDLRAQLAARARARVLWGYTWRARAEAILAFIRGERD